MEFGSWSTDCKANKEESITGGRWDTDRSQHKVVIQLLKLKPVVY